MPEALPGDRLLSCGPPRRQPTLVVPVLGRPRPVTHGGAFDRLTRLGFTVLPQVYDAWVGPLFA
jgi:hypothetical protein